MKGGFCITHGLKVKRSVNDVASGDKYIQGGGVCITHGAKRERKRCRFERCTYLVLKAGVCSSINKNTAASRDYQPCPKE
jgi:hypothetical protein